MLTRTHAGLRVLAAVTALGVGLTAGGVLDPSLVHTHFLPLLTGGNAFAFALAAYLYASSFRGKKLLAAGGNTGNAVYDFFIGRELNPRCGTRGTHPTRHRALPPL